MIILRQKEFASLKQLNEQNTRHNNMWLNAVNKVREKKDPGAKKLTSWQQMDKNNFKRQVSILKKPKFGNLLSDIKSEDAGKGYRNLGGKSSNTAHKLTKRDLWALKNCKTL